MGLNDEAEKLRQAEQWLLECDVSSQSFQAAWEYLLWFRAYTHDSALKAEAQRIYEQYR